MSPLTKMLFDLEYKGWKKGAKDGKKNTMTNIVKNMLQCNEPEEKIINYIGITKEELENIKSSI